MTRLYWLALGTFAIGTEGFMIAPLLPDLARDLSVSLASAGQLVTVFALTYALSSPVLTALTGKIDRRRLLIASMLAFAAANFVAWSAHSYVSGSQIQLNFMGVSPIQTKDFWITPEAKTFWNASQFERIDAELLRLEGVGEGYVFDTSTMPWRHRKPALCIWLKSSLESRVIKSIVSHRGRGRYSRAEYAEKIAKKDRATIELYKTLYGIEIGSDLSCFDLIIDISSLITDASLDASLRSINSAHEIIKPASAWYLTRRREFFEQFEVAVRKYHHLIKRNLLIENLSMTS